LWANYGGQEMNRLAAGVLKGKEKPQSELRLGKEQSEARQDEGFGGLSPAVRAEYTAEARLNLSTSYINLKAGETIVVLINWNDPRIPTDEIRAIALKTRLMREVQPQAETTIQRLALGCMLHNFVRINTVRMTTCMAAGIAGTIWTMPNLLAPEV
jgi:hypothetical protein